MGIKIISDNKKARFDYQLIDTFEAGMVLVSSEIKSLRAGSITLKDAYVSIKRGEAYLEKAHISEYKASSYNNHTPERSRKLLLHKEEIDQIDRKMREKGFSCVPTKVYLKRGFVKVEIALARGKKQHDKRDSIKNKDLKREADKALKRNR